MAFIRPSFMDSMSWEMAEVYGAITDQILINLARHFPYWKQGQPVPQSSFEYQASMLAQMGQVNAETIKIIKNGLTGANKALANVLEQAIIEAVKKSEPGLLKGVKAGILHPAGIPIVAPNQYRAFNLYYQQAAQKLNLVNTVMLESTKQAYQATVADVAARVQATQTALDIGAGEVVTGVSSWNQALTHSINRMKENGITGFIDHGNHHWSAEAYTAMDIRTTVANTARAAVWETNENFGNDLYLVSYHNGARPLCYPWQNKVISANDRSGVTHDLDGNEIEVIPQNITSYGEAAGLFGINCKHYPTPFIPGVSLIRGEPQSKEDNDKAYAESQQQRALERKIREEKRDLAMLKAQGASPEQIKAQRAKIRQTDDDIDAFCEKTGRARRQNREGVYTQREFPDANTYDVTQFERSQKELIDNYFENGGSQQGYTFSEAKPNEPKKGFYEEFGDAPQPTYRDTMEYGTDEYMQARKDYKEQSAAYKEKVGSWFDENYGNKTVTDEQFTQWMEKHGIVQYGSLDGLDRRALAAYMERFDKLSADFPQVLENRKLKGLPFEISYNPHATWTAEATHGMSFGNGFDDYRYVTVGTADVVKTGMVHGENPALQVFDHEFGHQLFDAMQKTGLDLDDVTLEISEMRRDMRNDLISTLQDLPGISEYATTNADELFAEAFSAWYGGETTPFANAFGDYLRRWGVIQ